MWWRTTFAYFSIGQPTEHSRDMKESQRKHLYPKQYATSTHMHTIHMHTHIHQIDLVRVDLRGVDLEEVDLMRVDHKAPNHCIVVFSYLNNMQLTSLIAITLQSIHLQRLLSSCLSHSEVHLYRNVSIKPR